MKLLKYTLLGLLLLLFSCGEYPDDPKIKIFPKNMLISKTWEIDNVFYVSDTATHYSNYKDWKLVMNDNETFTKTIMYGTDSTQLTGTWAFIGPEEFDFKFETPVGKKRDRYIVLRLTRKDFWLKNDYEEIHYRAE